MPRQVLTIVIFALLGLFLFQTCSSKDQLPPALGPVESGKRPETRLDKLTVGDMSVELAPDGTVVSVQGPQDPVLRPLAKGRRPFNLLLRVKQHKIGLEKALGGKWRRETIDGGAGRRFTLENENGFKVVRTVRPAPDGDGLDLEIELSGMPENLDSLWLTGASGVAMPDDGGSAFWVKHDKAVAAGDAELRSFAELVQEREEERLKRQRAARNDETVPRRFDQAQRVGINAHEHVTRFGLVGAKYAVAFHDLPDEVTTLRLDVFRTRRDNIGETPEIESWIEIAPGKGSYKGTFGLRWLPSDSVARETRTEARQVVLENDSFRAVLTSRGAALRSLALKTFSTEDGEEPTEDTWVPMIRDLVGPGKRALTLSGASSTYGSDPAHEIWEVAEATADRVVFAVTSSNGWRFRKTVTLPREGYALDISIEVVRPDGSSASEAKFSLVGPAASYVADAYRGTFASEPAGGGILERGGDDDDRTIDDLETDGELSGSYGPSNRGKLRAIFVRGAYFVCALVTDEPDTDGASPPTVTTARLRYLRLTSSVERPDGSMSDQSVLGRVTAALPLSSSGSGRVRYRFYAGPNARSELKPLRIEDTVDFGFFGFLGRGLMWLLRLFQGLVGNWGVAIALLTFAVRAMLLPISYRTQVGMQRYQKKIAKIKPILEELEKRYGKNQQKMNQERMRVMKEHGVGFPLGCLTMFLQIPIWFALFQALRVEFALRHADFLWASDLSMPDRVASLPFWPHWLNLFPILMLVLWVVQQKFAPTSGSKDPQMAMQMKMMRFMPYLFFFMLYRYASALSIYMCVSSTWTIFESRYVRKAIKRIEV